jgi:hypothetical protein
MEQNKSCCWSEGHNSSTTRSLRCWYDDFNAVEAFCLKYGFGYGEVVYDSAEYSVFFQDVDGDEIQCCFSKNTGDLSTEPHVKDEDIVLIIPLNERDLKTDVCEKLMKYWLENQIVTARSWSDDWAAVEAFCAKYKFGYGNVVEDGEKYSVFFEYTDGDEMQCYLSMNSGDLSTEPIVKNEDIVLIIPLNERDLKTDVCAELMKYCLENNIIAK